MPRPGAPRWHHRAAFVAGDRAAMIEALRGYAAGEAASAAGHGVAPATRAKDRFRVPWPGRAMDRDGAAS